MVCWRGAVDVSEDLANNQVGKLVGVLAMVSPRNKAAMGFGVRPPAFQMADSKPV
jgi:hypothetical protein